MNIRWYRPDDYHMHYDHSKTHKIYLHRHPHDYEHCIGRCDSHSDYNGDPDPSGSFVYEDSVAYTDSDVRANRKMEARKHAQLMKKLKS